MISFNSLSATSRITGWNFEVTSFHKKIIGVMLVAFAALATCYIIWSRCFKNNRVENKKPDDDQTPQMAVKEKKVAQDILQPPKESPRAIEEEPEPIKIDEDKQADVQQIEEPKKEEQKPQTISNWDELEAYARPLLDGPDRVIEVPGRGKVETRLLKTLLDNRQDLSWDTLVQTKKIQCTDETFMLDGWYSAALCINSPIYRRREAMAQKTDGPISIDLDMSQLGALLTALSDGLSDDAKLLLSCYSAASHLECSSISFECINKMSLRLFSLTFEPKNVQTVVDIYNSVKDQDRDTLKPALANYFKRAVSTPGTHFPQLYQLIKKQPELVSLLIAGAFEDWKTQDKNESVSQDHLGNILTDVLDDADYVACVATLVEQASPHVKNDDNVYLKVKRLFERLSGQQVEELTRMIFTHAKDPSKLVQFLMNVYAFNHDTKVATICLEKMPPGANLQKHLDWFTDPTKLFNELSIDQAKLLVKQWQATLDQKNCLNKLRSFFKLSGQDVAPMVGLCVELNINRDQLLNETQKEQYHARLCAAWALHDLRSEFKADIRRLGAESAIAHLSSLADAKDKDHQYLFGAYMAKHCDSKHFGVLFEAMSNGAARAPRVGEGFFRSFFKNATGRFDEKDFFSYLFAYKTNLQEVFKAYWPYWKRFDIYMPYLSYEILPMIATEHELQAAYDAIPQHAAGCDQIIKHLKEPITIDKRTYRVNLPQDVIDRIVI